MQVQKFADLSVPLGSFFGSISLARYPGGVVRRFDTRALAQAYIVKRQRMDAIRPVKGVRK